MEKFWRLCISPTTIDSKVRNFLIRTVVTVFLVPVTLVFVWAGGWWLTALLAACAFLGGHELAKLISVRQYKPVKLICAVWAAATVLVSYLYLSEYSFQSTFLPVLVSACLAPLCLVARKQRFKYFCINYITTFGVPICIGGLLSFAVFLNNLDHGRNWLFTLVAIVAATDIAGYIFGSLFGKHKLAPIISPSKTWEGGGAGLTFAIGTSIALYYLLELPINLSSSIGFGVLIWGSALVGDLLESFIKRVVGAKDSGSLIPGHGGILDRMDSILISLIVGYYFVLWTVD